MHISAPAIVLCSTFALSQVAGPDVTGQWKLHMSIYGVDTDQDCVFSQKAGILTGSCKNKQYSVQISGRVEGNEVSWSYTKSYIGMSLTLKFDGKLDKNKIAGGVTVDPYGVNGDFSAAKAE